MIEFKIYKPEEGPKSEISQFIKDMEGLSLTHLGMKTDLDTYIDKTYKNATKFTYWDDGNLIGLGLAYINKAPRESFGTYLCVHPDYASDGLGLDISLKALKYAETFGTDRYIVVVRDNNKMLNKFFKKLGFIKTNSLMVENSNILENEYTKYFNK